MQEKKTTTSVIQSNQRRLGGRMVQEKINSLLQRWANSVGVENTVTMLSLLRNSSLFWHTFTSIRLPKTIEVSSRLRSSNAHPHVSKFQSKEDTSDLSNKEIAFEDATGIRKRGGCRASFVAQSIGIAKGGLDQPGEPPNRSIVPSGALHPKFLAFNVSPTTTPLSNTHVH